MKATPDCIPCLFRQALNTARIASADPRVHARILRQVAQSAARVSLAHTPAAYSQPAYAIVAQVTGRADPYARLKREHNRAALRLLPKLERLVRRSPDPLKAAIHLAAAGNVIDLGIGHPFNLEPDVLQLMQQPFAIDDYAPFQREIRPGRRLLYLGDNAGEIVFDRVLVEYLKAAGMEITFAVKSGPIINDVTLVDARATGMVRRAKVIETGNSAIGVDWLHSSPEFRRVFRAADVVLAKGHGNFETCCERQENIYFLLKAKCDVVAAALGVQCGDTVFKHGGPPKRKRAGR